MPVTLHIINLLNIIYSTPVTTGNVEVCDAQDFVKQKTSHKKCATPNSILICVSAQVKNIIVLQGRKIQTLSVPVTYAKGNYFLIKVVTEWHKSYNTTYKRCANTIIRYRTQIMLDVKNIAIITSETFLKIEEEPSNNLQLSKIYKNEKNYSKKTYINYVFFGSAKVFR